MRKIPEIKKEFRNFLRDEDGMSPKSKIITAGILITALTKTEFVSACHGSNHGNYPTVTDHGNCDNPSINSDVSAHANAPRSCHGSAHANWVHTSGGSCGVHASAGANHSSSPHASSAGTLTNQGTLHGNHDHCSDEHASAAVGHGSAHASC